MNGAEQLARALHEWRAGRVEQLIRNHGYTPILHGGRILPCHNAKRPGWIGAFAGGRPCEDDDVGIRAGDVFVRDALPRRRDELTPGNPHEFRHPGRGTDPRVRPGLAIHTWSRRFVEHTYCSFRNSRKCGAHSRNEPFSGSRAVCQTAERSYVLLDIRQTARVQGQKRHRLFEQFRHCFWSKRDGADKQRWPQSHHFINVELPAIANPRQPPGVRNFVTPLAHADHSSLRANSKQNRRDAGRERNNSQSLVWRVVCHGVSIVRGSAGRFHRGRNENVIPLELPTPGFGDSENNPPARRRSKGEQDAGQSEFSIRFASSRPAAACGIVRARNRNERSCCSLQPKLHTLCRNARLDPLRGTNKSGSRILPCSWLTLHGCGGALAVRREHVRLLPRGCMRDFEPLLPVYGAPREPAIGCTAYSGTTSHVCAALQACEE